MFDSWRGRYKVAILRHSNNVSLLPKQYVSERGIDPFNWLVTVNTYLRWCSILSCVLSVFWGGVFSLGVT